MKKLLLTFLIFNSSFLISTAQVLCIKCYDQNARVLQDTAGNLILNGGFENGCGINGYFCPNSTRYNCNITNWTCIGGGSATYAHVVDSTFSTIVQGTIAVYFGNYVCYPCSGVFTDSSCLIQTGCRVTGIPPDYPNNTNSGFGGDTGVSLSQAVSGLRVGNQYELEFWAGGEYDSGLFYVDGLFAVDVGFGNIFLRDPPTAPNTNSGNHIGRRFIIIFTATSTIQIIKFTNWGHINYGFHKTELILDDVRMFAANPDEQLCAIGIKETIKSEVSVSPNPFSSSFVIKTGGPLTNGRINVYNVLGAPLPPKGGFTVAPSNEGLRIELDAPAGIYFLEVVTDEGAEVVRLVKM